MDQVHLSEKQEDLSRVKRRIKTEIYSILAHPIRRDLLLILEREGYLRHNELMEKLHIDRTGKLNFHLKKLESFLTKEKKTGAYYLSDEGKQVIKLMDLNERVLRGDEIAIEEKKKGNISRVGVLICKCTDEIPNLIDINVLERNIRHLENVVSLKVFDNLCQEKNLKIMHQWIKDNYLNKVVIAACSPKTHQYLFESMFDGIIDRTNIEIANIREQCCWVHNSDQYRDLALKKVELLIEAAIQRVIMQKNIKLKSVKVKKSCAIIGGGIAGMNLALNLSKAGIKVYIIEKTPTLGGLTARWSKIQGMTDCSVCFISELIGEIVKRKDIEIFTNTEIESVSGELGNFSLELIKRPRYVDEMKCTGCARCTEICKIEKNDQYEFGLIKRKRIYIPFSHAYPYAAIIDPDDINSCKECRICERACINHAINLDQEVERFRIKVGSKVIAIGNQVEDITEKQYHDPQKDVLTTVEFERMLASDGPTDGRIVKLSDGKPPESISFIVNANASDQMLELTGVIIKKYLEAIATMIPDCGVALFQESAKGPSIHLNFPTLLGEHNRVIENVKITREKGHNIITTGSSTHESDMIILDVGINPNRDLKTMRKKFDFTLNDDGFMSEETLASGVFGAGAVLGPTTHVKNMFSVNKVALDIISLLSHEYLLADYEGIEIDHEKCGLCSLCVKMCPYNALTIENEKLVIDKFKCKGCGTCTSVCPTNALELNVNSSGKIAKEIDVYSKFCKKPRILAFCCRSCGYAAADNAGLRKIKYNPNIFIIKVPCTGRVDTRFIIKAFEMGFDGVMVIGCKKDSCRYIDGIIKIEKKIKLLNKIMNKDLENRIILASLSAVEGHKFADLVIDFYNRLAGEIGT